VRFFQSSLLGIAGLISQKWTCEDGERLFPPSEDGAISPRQPGSLCLCLYGPDHGCLMGESRVAEIHSESLEKLPLLDTYASENRSLILCICTYVQI